MMRHATRTTSSLLLLATSSYTQQRRGFQEHPFVGQTARTQPYCFGDVIPKQGLPSHVLAQQAGIAAVGNAYLCQYTTESMFDARAGVATEAKGYSLFPLGFENKYVVRPLDEEIAAIAAERFGSRFLGINNSEAEGKDSNNNKNNNNAVEEFFTRIMKKYPASTWVFGTAEEVAAFEAKEKAKVSNNKLIQGRVGATLMPFEHARQPLLEFYTNLLPIAAASEAEVAKVAAPRVLALLEKSFISMDMLWRCSETLVEVMATLPHMTRHDVQCITLATERITKIALNTIADQPWATSAMGSSVQMPVCGHRAMHEAGVW